MNELISLSKHNFIHIFKDCRYVENLVWFKKSINNMVLDQPSPYISSTKEILLMFKKGDVLEIRHQRSPDVVIEFEPPVSQWIHEGNNINKGTYYNIYLFIY